MAERPDSVNLELIPGFYNKPAQGTVANYRWSPSG